MPGGKGGKLGLERPAVEVALGVVTELAIALVTMVLIAVGFVGLAYGAVWSVEAIFEMVFDLIGEMQ